MKTGSADVLAYAELCHLADCPLDGTAIVRCHQHLHTPSRPPTKSFDKKQPASAGAPPGPWRSQKPGTPRITADCRGNVGHAVTVPCHPPHGPRSSRWTHENSPLCPRNSPLCRPPLGKASRRPTDACRPGSHMGDSNSRLSAFSRSETMYLRVLEPLRD